jgi:hypothetical protein
MGRMDSYMEPVLYVSRVKTGEADTGRGIIGTAQGQAVEPERLTVSGWTC